MLELIKVTKAFRENNGEFLVLKDFSFSVKEGEFVCLVGPSGCGKSILLSLIAGFLPPTSGEIFLDGEKVVKPSRDLMMVFQNYSLFPWLTVYQNIAFGLETLNFNKEEKDYRIKKFLSLINLLDFKDWYVHKLSGGMQQRVALARALIADPKILLTDEPFAALDSQYRKFLRKNLIEIWQQTKKTIIFVTHSLVEALDLADTIYLVSSRPTTIKEVFKISLPRPRNHRSEEFNQIIEKMENCLAEEFNKIIL